MTRDDPTGLADVIRCGDAGEGAALGLLALMTGISEECWCAGWISGLEYELWRVEARPYGRGDITVRQAMLLRLLADECDGWWWWAIDCPSFIRTGKWLAKITRPSAPSPPEPSDNA